MIEKTIAKLKAAGIPFVRIYSRRGVDYGSREHYRGSQRDSSDILVALEFSIAGVDYATTEAGTSRDVTTQAIELLKP